MSRCSRCFSSSFDFLEFISRFETDSSEVLEGILDDVRNGRGSEVTRLKGDSGNVEHTLAEVLKNSFRVDRENLRIEDVTVVIISNNGHTIREGLDVHLLEKSNFGVTDLSSLNANEHFLGNFDLTLLNLGGDRKSVEEVNLRGVHTGGAGRNDNITLSDSSDSSGSRHNERFNLGLKLEDGVVVEDITDLVLEVRNQRVKLRFGSTELSEPVVFLISRKLSSLQFNGFSHDGLEKKNHKKFSK